MSATVKAGILGTGFMGRVHARSVAAAGGDVIAVAGSSPASGRAAAERLPRATAVETVAQMLDLGVDVIHICTPNALHLEQAEQAIAHGVPVVCEKPLATTVGDALLLTRLAEDAGIDTAVPFVYRYYPLVLEARRRIAAGVDNPLWLLHGSYLQDWLADRNTTNWRVDPSKGGASRAFGDIGVHWCDLMEFVTGHRITRLQARLGNAFERAGAAQNETEDGGVVMFETDLGAVGSLVVSQASAGRRNRLWFSFDGPTESFVFDQEAPETLWVGGVDENRTILRDPARQSSTARSDALPAGHPQGYQRCFDDLTSDMYSVIRGEKRRDILPGFADGLRAATITEAVIQSASSGRWTDVVPAGDRVLERSGTR